MADWTYTPEYSYSKRTEGERLIVNRLEDFSEVRVEKGSTQTAVYVERYTASGAELTAMLAFFNSYRLANTFTKLTYDPGDIGFDPDDPSAAAGPEQTVRFESWPDWKNTTFDSYSITFEFRVLPNE